MRKKKAFPLTLQALRNLSKFTRNELLKPQRMSKKTIQAMIDANGGPERMKFLIASIKLK